MVPGAALAEPRTHDRHRDRSRAGTPLLDRIRGRISPTAGAAGDAGPGPRTDAAALLAVFGVPPPAGDAPPPVAALAALGDGLPVDTGQVWLRADPVCMQPSGADLLLLPPSTLQLDPDEADDLLESIRGGLGCAVGRWYRGGEATRWYLAVECAVQARFLPPDACVGQGLDRCLPTGTGADEWIRRMNEIQMILHEHPVNERRESRGAPPANSVWFWGAGPLPAGLPEHPGAPRRAGWDRVCTDDPVALGLARLCSIPAQSPPPDADTLLAALETSDRALVVFERETPRMPPPDDSDPAWLEREWLEPACEALLDGRVQSLTVLDPGVGTVSVGARDLMPWWRRWLS